MTSRRSSAFIGILILCAAAILSSPVTAGTTGALTGFVSSPADAPITGAKVSATSPSQDAATVTDARGQFNFVSLIPDRYSVTASKEGFRVTTVEGIDVVADNTRTIRIIIEPVKTLGQVTITRSGIVSAGTTVDIYSVNRPLQQTVVGLNGGTSLDQAYSGIASVPGTFVPPAQTGWNQPVFIRGGSFDEVGYEYDGIPTNRAFDNISTSTLSTLGQQSVQIYTGAAPASADARSISGYVNQVVRTGTYPGFADLTIGLGAPTYYNKINLDVGGATPNRRFTYFVDVGGWNQDFRYADQFNGAAYSRNFGQPFDLQNIVLGPLNGGAPGCGLGAAGSNFTGCYSNVGYFDALPAGPGGYVIGPYSMGKNAQVNDRENVGNFHLKIPHRGSNAADDIQLLYSVSQLYSYTYSSYNDWGGPAFWNGYNTTPGFHSGSVPVFVPGFGYNGALLAPLAGTLGGPTTGVFPYFFPSAGLVGAGSPIPLNQRDSQSNSQDIVKVQYQHFFSPDEYLRIYGYSAYSNWFTNSPNGQSQFYVSLPADRELSSHTKGISADYTNQLSTQHLLKIYGSYVTGQDLASENDQPSTGAGGGQPPWFPAPQSVLGVLVNSATPTSGICYYMSAPAFPFPPTPTSCEPITPLPSPFVSLGAINFKSTTYSGVALFGPPPTPAGFFPVPFPGFEWLAVESGPTGPKNAATPKFSGLSIEDQWKPSDKWHFNIGVRWDRYEYDIPPTAGGAARAFWFNAWNQVECANPGVNGGGPVDETLLGLPPATPCSTLGPGWGPATLTNSTANGASVAYNEVQPRIGGTYTVDPNNVLRFSYGVYSQPPPSQFQYVDTYQQNLPAYLGPLFFALGDTTPQLNVRPQVSYNYDFSWEHRFREADTAFKFTPFLRDTRDQIQRFFLNPVTGTIGGVNAGKQTSSGVEFQLTKGDFTRDGLSLQLSYTYTYSSIQYQALPNGLTLLSPVNSSIQKYNSYTSACATASPSTNPLAPCGVFGPANASPCFAPNGAPDPTCAAPGTVGNPYFNDPARGLLDPNGHYPTYYVVPTGTQLSSASIGVPDVLALVLSYKHGRYTVAPLFQYVEGSKYGAPQQQIGVDPATCFGVLATPVTGDPRYTNGGSGNAYDATTCTGTLVIPDQYTGNFDAPGAFREPNLFSVNMQLAYDVSPRTTLNVTLANILTSCFGGTQMPWVAAAGRNTCGFDVLPGHVPPVGNIYNPGSTIQPLVQYPYGNAISSQPFNAYFNLTFKL